MTFKEFLNIEEHPIIVAIDFGTTFSGCAFAYAPEDKEPRIISDWPGQKNQYVGVPTLSLYQTTDGNHKMVDWGWSSKSKMDTTTSPDYVHLNKFKPYLDQYVTLAKWESIITIEAAISDYLEVIHKYITKCILGQFGPSFSQKKFRYCLTVPAIWSDKAKDVMRKAAIKASLISEDDHIDRLTLVSEPEAAALYCERACNQYDVKHGEQFMICDAGGGTVDLIVYKIDDSSGERRLSEVTKGDGASCGSMFIDSNFTNMLIEKFSSQTMSSFPRDIIPRLVEKFAYEHKPLFDGEEDQYLPIPRETFFDSFANPTAIKIENGYMCLCASELKERVFEPVVEQVLDLIRQQLSVSECSAIFMVGGFGSSNYLLDRVRQEFGSKVRTIASPYKPETAVVCGAVYAGLNPKVVATRVIRRYYGVKCFMEFEKGVDLLDKRVKRANGDRCRDRFSTIVRKGQNVKVDECVTREYGFVNDIENNFSVEIYATDDDPPRYTTSSRVHLMGSIPIPDPFLPSDPKGTEIKCEVKLYFGLSQIRAEVHSRGSIYCDILQVD